MVPLIICLVVFVLVALFTFALCKVAARADEQSDAAYAELMKHKPEDPPAKRAGLRIVKG